ncbi:CTP:molybdopterin cytidylyltransferase MocA [Paenibacillus rhizosphaerae]|uniref:CTP:molybdopterin cytidylyltransferase MocA n=1 Tax=Paenibacillus rhizosphaerae TaxID=297318 RepID=A0A839TJT9_9BACL|nr:hypothetical protein [Paenibacillus rhizosphaerae]MBB3125658.1 CTP:molybdopterin cytidylyltransferase MocA [Paenibacillus rhizosphaerae]
MKQHSIHAIYLAAGQSSRMGTSKLALPLGGNCAWQSRSLIRLQGDEGARQLIRHGRPGISIPFGSPDLFLDVDTPEDYGLLRDKENADSPPKS